MMTHVIALPDSVDHHAKDRILVGRLLGDWIERDSIGPFRVYLIADGRTGRQIVLAAADLRLKYVIEMEDPRPGDLLVLVQNDGAVPELVVVRGTWSARASAWVRFRLRRHPR